MPVGGSVFIATHYGFKFGACEVERMDSDPVEGWVIVSVRTATRELLIHVTATGDMLLTDFSGSPLTMAPARL